MLIWYSPNTSMKTILWHLLSLQVTQVLKGLFSLMCPREAIAGVVGETTGFASNGWDSWLARLGLQGSKLTRIRIYVHFLEWIRCPLLSLAFPLLFFLLFSRKNADFLQRGSDSPLPSRAEMRVSQVIYFHLGDALPRVVLYNMLISFLSFFLPSLFPCSRSFHSHILSCWKRLSLYIFLTLCRKGFLNFSCNITLNFCSR